MRVDNRAGAAADELEFIVYQQGKMLIISINHDRNGCLARLSLPCSKGQALVTLPDKEMQQAQEDQNNG